MGTTDPLDALFGGNPTTKWQQVVEKLKAADPTGQVTLSLTPASQPAVRTNVKPGDPDWGTRVSLSVEELDDLMQTVKSARVKDVLSEARYLLKEALTADKGASAYELQDMRRKVSQMELDTKYYQKREKKARKKYKAMKAEWDRRTEKMHEALEAAEDYRQQLRDLTGE